MGDVRVELCPAILFLDVLIMRKPQAALPGVSDEMRAKLIVLHAAYATYGHRADGISLL